MLLNTATFEPFASCLVAFVGGWLLWPPGLFLWTVTHFKPCASGPVALAGGWLF